MSTTSPPTLSLDVVLASYNRPAQLRQCIESLVAAFASGSNIYRFRILVALRESDFDSVLLMQNLKRTIAEIECSTFANIESPGSARNRLLEKSDAEWLFFIDDDAFVDADFFARFAQLISANLTSANHFPKVIGGPNLTPPQSSPFQIASGITLASRFGSFVSAARYCAEKFRAGRCGEEALSSCNLFVHRSALQNRKFPEHLCSNEENWLLQDLREAGHDLLYTPSLFVWHERRPQLSEFLHQIFRYGVGRGQNLKSRPSTFRFFHIIPSIALLFSILTFSMWLSFSTWLPITLLGYAWLSLALVYIFLWIVTVARMKLIYSESTPVCLIGGLLLPMVHTSYGLGVLKGISGVWKS